MATRTDSGLMALPRIIWMSVGLYALFVLPTLLFVAYGGVSGSEKQTIDAFVKTWQATYWHFPGLSAVASRIVLDIAEAGVIAVLAFLFYRGFQCLSALPEKPSSPKDEMEEKRLVWLIFTALGVASLLLVFVIPFHSSDLYGYLNRGFQQSVLHTNPYITPIADIPHWRQWPFLQEHWIYNPCPYGFLFAQFMGGLTAMTGARFFPAFFALKISNALWLLGSSWLVYRLAGDFLLSRPLPALYLFALNPLVLLHVMGNGHNDILMAFLLLASLWTMQKASTRLWTWPLLTLSVLTKYASVLLAPFMLVFFIRRRDWRALFGGSVLSVVLLLLLAWPYIQTGQPWPWRDFLDNAGKSQHSVIDMLATLAALIPGLLNQASHPGEPLFSASIWKSAVGCLKPIFLTGFAAFYGLCLWRSTRRTHRLTPASVAAFGAESLVILVAFAGAKFHPWYIVMFLPLALLLRENNGIRRFSLLFGLIQLAGFTVLQNLAVVNVLLLTLYPLVRVLKNRDPFRIRS